MKTARMFSALIFLSALQPWQTVADARNNPSAFPPDASSWQYRQEFEVAQAQGGAGPLRIAVPPGTLDHAQADLRDLRILGPDGAEVPYTVLALPAQRASQSYYVSSAGRPVEMRLDSGQQKISVEIETGTTDPIESIELQVADTKDYMLPARVEVSSDRTAWTVVGKGWPMFRRNQARHDAVVENTFRLNGVAAAHVRITIPAGETQLAITGAVVRSRKTAAEAPPAYWESAAAPIADIEQKPGETRLTVDLGAANLAINTLALDIADPLFIRHVTVAAGDGRVAGGGQLYRFAIDEGTSAESVKIALGGAQAPARRVILRIDNGDSPPLRVRGVIATYRAPHIVFNPVAAGRHVFLSGNAQAAAPRYDLAAMSEKFGRLPLSKITADAIAAAPDYRAPEPPREPWNLTAKVLFWVALAALVIVLLAVVAKLLPKAKE